ncbi:SEC63 domain-containing protein [Cryptosporidium ubiquitum]|uniref:SEC63 domain-containing protein n=1 Tax=Cryptosporidium ubiquitum TaxID=857276 RepID=A0A1J4MRE0_9CRYT|nr:SEC63 domain-containing protein [Cryptosporidium ubiquitum]OII75461.1 SEC63 domain-containing protein [Cryptosporidium ubiquitum]
MVDDYEMSKRFGYKANSNLVIQTGQRNRENVPTGEAESLAGRIKYKMGDLANKRSKPKIREKKQVKKRTNRSIVNENDSGNILDLDLRNTGSSYIPTTMETRLAYDELLGILADILGSQPSKILEDIAFELLLVLKNDELRDEEKRKKCKEIIIQLNNTTYSDIVDKSRRLVDFTLNMEETVDFQYKQTEEASEVAVIFDESDSDNKKGDISDGDDISEDDSDSDRSDDEEDDNEDYYEDNEYYDEEDATLDIGKDEAENYLNEDSYTNDTGNNENQEHIGYIRLKNKDDHLNENEDPDIIDIWKLDAYWLQRELYSLFQDAEKSLDIERKIISILNLEDDQECENSLVILFNYEHFNWIKKVLKNRWSIYFCTILGQAPSDSEREKIIDRMRDHQHGSEVLDLFSKPSVWKNKDSDFFKSINKYIEESSVKIGDFNEGDKSALYSRRYQAKLLDLDRIYQEQNLNLNLNTKVVLPQGSERTENTDYDSITIPPLKRQMKEKSRLISIEELPEWSRECFRCVSVSYLNEIQSKVFHTAFKEFEENLLVCAPTGSGKTNIAMLCILNIISQFIVSQNNGKFTLDTSKFKIVYISPMKALVSEQVESFRIRLKPLGILVNEMTGDTRISRSLIEMTQVFVTTPEKFDVVTRKTTDGLSEKLKLIILDEVHMLHDSRGSILEGIVARFKNNFTRLVGLSATLPNFIDVAEFLDVNPKKGLYHFGPEYRPVPLLQTFIGIKAKKGFRKLQLMNSIVYDTVIKDITNHQILVFVHSRKDTIQTAKFIRDTATESGMLNLFFPGNNNVSREIILDELSNIKSNNLKEILPCGVGIHHAGLVRSDRKVVEDLFSDGHIKVLVTTATLAWGVNLPAHTVIIKGTQIYQPERGEWTELSPLDMLQMIGRGGRPQYDNNGHGIVITDFDHLTYYLSLLNQQLNIESQLIPKLPDLINAEISLGNLQNKKDVLKWIKKTFLYIRIIRNPNLYGLNIDEIINKNRQSEDLVADDEDTLDEKRDLAFKNAVESYLTKLIDTALDRLEACKLIQYNYKDGHIGPLTLGRISSHFYLSPETIQDLDKQLVPNLSEIQLFRLFSTCKEFKFLIVRSEEKIELEKLVDKVPIPIQGVGSSTGVDDNDNIGNMVDLDTFTKVNVLLQLYITGTRWINAKLTLLSDLHFIAQSAPRIFRAIFNLAIKRRWSILARKTLKIATMIERRSWEAMLPLRQFKGISEEVVKRLEKKDISWNTYYDFTSNQLGEMLKSSKLGPVLYNLIRKIPRLEMSGTIVPIDSKILQLDLVIKPNFIWDSKVHGQSMTGDVNTDEINTGETFWILIEDCDGEYLYFSDMIIIRPSFNELNSNTDNEIMMQDEYYLSYQIFLEKKGIKKSYDQDDIIPPFIFVRAVADKWLHSETSISIPVENKIILPKNQYENTELLDLQPIGVKKAFSGSGFEIYLKKMFNIEDNDKKGNIQDYSSLKLNSIQTQLFNLIYNSDKSFYLSSPPGNGQFICTCIGILREMKKDSQFQSKNFQVLFLSCNKDKVDYYVSKFESIFGMNQIVSGLKGKTSIQIDQELNSKSIIVSDIETWDNNVGKKLTKTRDLVKRLKLLVIDGIEFLNNNSNGSAIESAISRIRYIITPLNLKIRIFAYSKCISNANEVSEWLGILRENVFSFDQNIFNESINKRIIAFDSYYRSSRFQMMLKYLKDNIILQLNNQSQGKKKTLLIFVLEYEFCLSLANELSLFIMSENDQQEEFITEYNSLLKFSLHNGIGFLYKNQSYKEREYILSQFSDGKIHIIIACENMKNFITLKFDHVIVMDTKKIDYEENRGSFINSKIRKTIDYSQFDIHQMLSRCKNQLNSSSNFTLLCSSNKQEFYEYIIKYSLPLESNIDFGIIDCLNTEIALKTIKTKQDTIDWITWTLFYRRISKNPSYYGLIGNTNNHISDYLSEYLESLLDSLSEAKCIQVESKENEDEENIENYEDDNEGDDTVVSLNLSLISAFYNLRVSTIEFISKNLSENVTYDSLIQLISMIPQLQEECLVRKGDSHILDQLCKDLDLNQLNPRSDNEVFKSSFNQNKCLSSRKIQVLLYSYIKRHKFILNKPLIRNDLTDILRFVMDLLFAMVDISSSYGWINTCLRIMELSQMFVQAISNPINDKLMQLSMLMNRDKIKVFKENGVSDIYDLINMNDNDRDDLLTKKLSLNEKEIFQIAQVCNDFPIIETDYSILGCIDLSETNKRRRVDSEISNNLKNGETQRLFECNTESDLNLSIDISRDFSSIEDDYEVKEEDSLKNQYNIKGQVISSCIVKNLSYYPLEKEENWWVILIEKSNPNIPKNINDENDDHEDKILGIRRIQLNKTSNQVNLRFNSIEDSGIITNYKLLIICDSYIGCDQEFTFSIKTIES